MWVVMIISGKVRLSYVWVKEYFAGLNSIARAHVGKKTSENAQKKI